MKNPKQDPELSDETVIVAPFFGSLTDAARVIPPMTLSVAPTTARSAYATAYSVVPLPVAPLPSAELGPGTEVNGYYIESKIGSGAMGTVYAALHPTIGKRVAIKVMSPHLCRDVDMERFIGEARAVSAIHHPGIVDVFGFGSLPDGQLYLVMEFLQGESLRDRMERGRIPLGEALELLDQLTWALDAAHDQGIIHRDLKPENIFLERLAKEPRPLVKILDFGLAKLVQDDGQVRRTQTGQLLGTPLYMSPEQCRARDVDRRTDLYAMGCIAYELVCGRVPFNADNVAEIVAAHLSETPPAPRSLWAQIPPRLEGLLVALLEKRADHRPTLVQMRAALAAVRTLPATPARRPHFWAPLTLAVVAVIAAVGGIAALRPEVRAQVVQIDAGMDASIVDTAPDVAVMPSPPPPQAPIEVKPRVVVKRKPLPSASSSLPIDPNKTTINPFRRKQP